MRSIYFILILAVLSQYTCFLPTPIKAHPNELSVSIVNKQYLEKFTFNFGSNLVQIRVKANIKNIKEGSIILSVKDGYVGGSSRFCSIKLTNGFCDTLLFFKTKPFANDVNDRKFYITAELNRKLKPLIYASESVIIGNKIWPDSIIYVDGINIFTLSRLNWQTGNAKRMPLTDEFGVLSNSGLPNLYEPTEKIISKDSVIELFKLLSELQNTSFNIDQKEFQKGNKYLAIICHRASFKRTLFYGNYISNQFDDYFNKLFESEIK